MDTDLAVVSTNPANRNRPQQCQHWSDASRGFQGAPEIQHQLYRVFFGALDHDSRGLGSFRGRARRNLRPRSSIGNRRIFSAPAAGQAIECFWISRYLATTSTATPYSIRIHALPRWEPLLGGKGPSP